MVTTSYASIAVHSLCTFDLRFQWQGGYPCFSVSRSNLLQVEEYIDRQEEHHRNIRFQEELRELLHKRHIEFDKRFVWD